MPFYFKDAPSYDKDTFKEGIAEAKAIDRSYGRDDSVWDALVDTGKNEYVGATSSFGFEYGGTSLGDQIKNGLATYDAIETGLSSALGLPRMSDLAGFVAGGLATETALAMLGRVPGVAKGLGWIGSKLGRLVGRGGVLRGRAYHYTTDASAKLIERLGLRSSSYLTKSGDLSPLQAHIDLALDPSKGIRTSVFEVDIIGAQKAGIEFTNPNPITRNFNMPGGGAEFQNLSEIPVDFLRRIK